MAGEDSCGHPIKKKYCLEILKFEDRMSNTINLPDLCCAFEDHSPCSREVLSTQWCRPKVHTARHGRGYFVVCVVCVVKLKPCCRLVCAEGFRAIRILLECTSCMSCHRHGSVQVLLRSLPLGAQAAASGPTHHPQNLRCNNNATSFGSNNRTSAARRFIRFRR